MARSTFLEVTSLINSLWRLLCLFVLSLAASGCAMGLRGPLSAALSANTTIPCPATLSTFVVEAVYPTQGANWMDYVTKTNATSHAGAWTLYNQPDAVCAGTESGYFSCIHGGEKKKVTLTGVTSCTGLTATDALGAFDWFCDASSGTATIYSRGLKSGKGLKDLLSASAFLSNSVSVASSGCTAYSTSSTVWWSNTVTPLPPDGTSPITANPLNTDPAIQLNAAGTIYTLATSTTSSGYVVNSDKTAIVTLGPAVLTYSGNATAHCDINGTYSVGSDYRSLICMGSRRFNWIEVSLSGNAATRSDVPIFIRSSQFVRVHETKISEPDSASGSALRFHTVTSSMGSAVKVEDARRGIEFINGIDSIVMDSYVGRARNTGIIAWGGLTRRITYYGAFVFSSEDVGMLFDDNAQDNFIVKSAVAGSAVDAIATWPTTSRATLLSLSAINGSTNGIALNNTSSQTTVNVVGINQASRGVSVANTSTNNRFYDVFGAYSNYGVAVVTNSTGNEFYGDVSVGQSSLNTCEVDGGSSAGTLLVDTTCFHGAGSAVAPGSTTIDPGSSYVGKVSTNDSSNSSDINGSEAYASISDWVGFESPFRGWGVDGVTSFLSAGLRGACTAGTCRIFDLRLESADAVLKNFNGIFVNGATCPSSLDASVIANVVTDLQNTPHTFLRAAVELMDGFGNGNGLCESGENCIFTPNRGSYQGEGDYWSQACTFTGGNGVTDVVMYAYPTNGR